MGNTYLQEIGVQEIDFRSFFYCVLFDEYIKDRWADVLDLWAGQWRNIMSLKRFGYTNLFACDLSDYFGDLYKQVGIPLAVADLENGKLPYEDSTFDVVIFAHVIEHLHSIENAMLEIKRVLKKGWILIMETPDYEKSTHIFWDDYTHIRPYTQKSFHRISGAYRFETIMIRNSQIADFVLNSKFAVDRFLRSFTKVPSNSGVSQEVKINISPIGIPASIQFMYKYLPWIFFWGTDMVAILKNQK